jgi:hypothetical protein
VRSIALDCGIGFLDTEPIERLEVVAAWTVLCTVMNMCSDAKLGKMMHEKGGIRAEPDTKINHGPKCLNVNSKDKIRRQATNLQICTSAESAHAPSRQAEACEKRAMHRVNISQQLITPINCDPKINVE